MSIDVKHLLMLAAIRLTVFLFTIIQKQTPKLKCKFSKITKNIQPLFYLAMHIVFSSSFETSVSKSYHHLNTMEVNRISFVLLKQNTKRQQPHCQLSEAVQIQLGTVQHSSALSKQKLSQCKTNMVMEHRYNNS